MAIRGTQPKCEGCNHPVSFHSGGASHCRALGCDCKMWKGKLPKKEEIKKS